MGSRLTATYRVRADAGTVEDRAFGIALEQSVEAPLAAIRSPSVLSEIVGRIEAIDDRRDGWFDVRIALATATIGGDAGQLVNMLFGNTSLQEDVLLEDVAFPEDLVAVFGGPRHGVEGLRQRAGANGRALTASALKPQGLEVRELASLAFDLAAGGLDFVKDDHGLADQAYSPFAERVAACAAATFEAAASRGHATRYVPSLSGSGEELDRQTAIARGAGLDTVMIAPMVVGLSNFQALRRAHPDVAFLVHPAMMGATRISPCVFAKIFRLLGADAFIFPNYGGRFGYSSQTCEEIADALREPWNGLGPSVPVPAGGMTLQRVPEMLDFYGPATMLLIGGNLLASPPGTLTKETERFVRVVADHDQGG